MTKRYKISYYFDEVSFRLGNAAFFEYLNGDRNSVLHIAQVHMKNNPKFKFFDIKET